MRLRIGPAQRGQQPGHAVRHGGGVAADDVRAAGRRWDDLLLVRPAEVVADELELLDAPPLAAANDHPPPGKEGLARVGQLGRRALETAVHVVVRAPTAHVPHGRAALLRAEMPRAADECDPAAIRVVAEQDGLLAGAEPAELLGNLPAPPDDVRNHVGAPRPWIVSTRR